MAKRASTRDVDKAYGRARLKAAHAFLEQAEVTQMSATDDYQRAAATSSAILAAIAAADAACALRLGQAWKGEHAQAHTFLRTIKGAEKAATALQRVVSRKTEIQYMAEAVSDAKLTAAIRQAETVIAFADEIQTSG